MDERPSPHELYRQAGGDRERYVALMKEHGHLVAKHEGVFDPTLPPGGWVCGVDGCLAPIETEPCDEHCPGPDAHLSEARRILGIDGGQ